MPDSEVNLIEANVTGSGYVGLSTAVGERLNGRVSECFAPGSSEPPVGHDRYRPRADIRPPANDKGARYSESPGNSRCI
jgi:hypothetical protein